MIAALKAGQGLALVDALMSVLGRRRVGKRDTSVLLDPGHLYVAPKDCVSGSGDYCYSQALGDGATAASAGDGSTSDAVGDSVKAASCGFMATSIAKGYAARSASAGDTSKSVAVGDFSVAVSAGDKTSASSHGECSISMAAGIDCTVQAGERGCFAACYYAPGNALRILAGYVGEDGIKANTPYRIQVDIDGDARWAEVAL